MHSNNSVENLVKIFLKLKTKWLFYCVLSYPEVAEIYSNADLATKQIFFRVSTNQSLYKLIGIPDA